MSIILVTCGTCGHWGPPTPWRTHVRPKIWRTLQIILSGLIHTSFEVKTEACMRGVPLLATSCDRTSFSPIAHPILGTSFGGGLKRNDGETPFPEKATPLLAMVGVGVGQLVQELGPRLEAWSNTCYSCLCPK